MREIFTILTLFKEGLVGGRELGTDWVYDIKDVNVEYIGEAKEGMPKGVVVGSFNAG
jgi:hypothetical protein